MGGFHQGQQVLQKIISNHSHDEGELPAPYLGMIPTRDPDQTSYSLLRPSTSSPTVRQQQSFAAKSSKLPESCHHHAHEEVNLDDFDRRLLAEPAIQLPWQSSHGLQGVPTARLSLPGHTAPFPPFRHFETQRPQPKPPTMPSPRELRSPLARYVHTPPAQMDLSSPTIAPPSSPSFGVRKRQVTNHSRPFVRQSASSTSHHFASHNPFKNSRKRSLQPFGGKKSPPQRSFSPLPESSSAQTRIGRRDPPIVQDIQLVSLNELPDRLRSVFRYPLFNAIQSKCFPIAYHSNNNLVVSAPTGGGKTAILEMAICRLVSGFKTDHFKIVYMAPTKSLCSERQRDWQARFAALDLQCAELTGDTERSQLRSVQSANIIVTTPEKWDSVTRKWKDHAKLMKMVKLFLIDEVHILKDNRGATLEAVVSRMKSVGSDVRFVALSATVPNSEDIAVWLGQDPIYQHLPALQERFGENFRPVKLQKHVIGLAYKGNDFGFEGVCDTKLPGIIALYSQKKPIMVFCITRNSTISTAKLLAHIWTGKGSQEQYWEGPSQRIAVQDPDLKTVLTTGVAFHHAGLDASDRHVIEKGFLEGQINVICCTSTLAVGVNLPCHLVIIKNTVSWSDNGLKEYADLEIMQMLGRAGRPQFDTSAVAIIITKQEKLTNYERLVSGQELLESCLHLNLIDHLHAEIGLGTVYDLYTAKRWLGGTFLYVRLGQNPTHYDIDGDAKDLDLDNRIERICKRDLSLLEESNLISSVDGRLRATELGDAMARYYVEFETMQMLLRLRPHAKLSDILSSLVQSSEFRDIRLKSHEKKLYREINSASGIRYPIKVDLALHVHKRSLILQAELGGVEFPADEQYTKQKRQFNRDKTLLFSHAHRLIHCVIDCQIYKRDAVSVQHALEIAASLSAKVWDNSPFQMKQIAQVGLVAIRRLVVGGINSIEALEAAEPHRIEMLLSKNPPFGQRLHSSLRNFPKLRVCLKLVSNEFSKRQPVIVNIKAECGFMNDKVPTTFHGKQIYVCLLTYRSDGYLIDFKRISANNLNNGKEFSMSAELLSHTQQITCSIMCDTVVGTLRHAELKPDLPAHLFPSTLQYQQKATAQTSSHGIDWGQSKGTPHTSPATLEDDEFGECRIEDQDMIEAAAGFEFRHIDNISAGTHGYKSKFSLPGKKNVIHEKTSWNPEKLDNGKWACNHRCKDKGSCKHWCCREGTDKAPKPPKGAFVSAASLVDASLLSKKEGSNAPLSTATNVSPSKTSTKGQPTKIETLDSLNDPDSDSGTRPKNSSKKLRNLQRLHHNFVRGPAALITTKQKFSTASANGDQLNLPVSSRDAPDVDSSDRPSTDYGDEWMGVLPSPSASLGGEHGASKLTIREQTDDGGSGQDDFRSSASAFFSRTPTLTRNHVEEGSPGKRGPLRFHHDHEGPGSEAALAGRNNLHAIGGDSQTRITLQGRPQDTAGTEGSSREGGHVTSISSIANRPGRHESCAPSNLFLSTDSPEKVLEVHDTQAECFDTGAGESQLAVPAAKRQRRCSQPGVGGQAWTKTASSAATASSIIKAGQPAWVYGFDAGFIAEWQDLVDFV